MAGVPGMPVLAMTRSTYDGLLEKVARTSEPAAIEERARKMVPATSGPKMSEFVSPAAQGTVANLSAYLPPDHYTYLNQQALRRV